MKPLSVALQNLFKTRQFSIANLFVWTLADGTVLHHTDFDVDLTWGGQRYTCGGSTGPYYGIAKKARASWKTGLQVDDCQFDIAPGQGLVRGVPWLQAITWGFLDGATIQRFRAYFPTGAFAIPVPVTGVMLMNSGRIGVIDGGRETAMITVKAYTELLDLVLPREVYATNCQNILYGPGCTLNRNNFSVNGTIALASAPAVLLTSPLGKPTGWFDQGTVKMTSGQLAGAVMTVKTWLTAPANSMSLIAPFPTVPAIGDAFTAYAGCDLLETTCDVKFHNKPNYRGQNFVPVAETAV